MAAQKGHIRAVARPNALETRNQLAKVSQLVGRTDRITLLQRSAAVYGAQCGANEVCCAQLSGLGGEATCAADCPGGGGPNGGIQLCATDDECPPDIECVDAPAGLPYKYCDAGFGGF